MSAAPSAETICVHLSREQADIVQAALEMWLHLRSYAFKEPHEDLGQLYGELRATVAAISQQLKSPAPSHE